jgi:hypothetical protein
MNAARARITELLIRSNILGGFLVIFACSSPSFAQRSTVPMDLAKRSRLEYILDQTIDGVAIVKGLQRKGLISHADRVEATNFIAESPIREAVRLRNAFGILIDGIVLSQTYRNEDGSLSPVEEARLRLAVDSEKLSSFRGGIAQSVSEEAEQLIADSPLPLKAEFLEPFLELERQSVESRNDDLYLKATTQLFDDLGIAYKIRYRSTRQREGRVRDWKIEILSKGESLLNRTVNTFVEAHDVSHFYFDPRSIVQGSYRKRLKSVLTGRPAVLFLTEAGLRTLRHEGLHAVLFSLKNDGVESIYNTQFHSSDVPLGSRAYARYFSAQELATMSSDLRQLAIRFLRERDPADQRAQLERLDHKLSQMQLVARQVRLATTRTLAGKSNYDYKRVDSGFTVDFAVDGISSVTLPYIYKKKPSPAEIQRQANEVLTQLNSVSAKIDADVTEAIQTLIYMPKEYRKIARLASAPYYEVRSNEKGSVRSLLDVNGVVRGKPALSEDCSHLMRDPPPRPFSWLKF